MKNTRFLALTLICLLILSTMAAFAAQEDIVIPELHFAQKEIPDLPSYQFVKNLAAGWNLGNTFDANNAHHLRNELDYESAWVGVKTQPEIFSALKAAGFQTVRIPVSWHNHVTGPGHQISAPWLERVKQVVDMALAEDLYVILNTHHDIEEDYLYPDEKHLDSSLAYMKAIWTQVSETFKDYDERLIMESMNEPRLKGTKLEWWLNAEDPRSAEAVRCINQLNQLFVDTVRASGGQNAQRYLLVPGYAASVQGCLHEDFEMPKEPQGAKDRLLLSVHAYTPYDFALQDPKEKESKDHFSADNAFDVQAIAVFMDQLYEKFVPLKTPIIIGEFGARDKGGNLQARVDFTAVYVALARARGITCVWWDNHGFKGDGELFGILDRHKHTFVHPEIVEAMIRYAK